MRPGSIEDWPRWFAPVMEIILSIAVTVGLFLLKITDEYHAIIAGIALALVLVLFRAASRLRSIERRLGYFRSLPELQRIVDSIQGIISSKPSRFQSILLRKEISIFGAMIDQLWRGRLSVSPDHFMRLAEVIYSELRPDQTLYATSVFGGGDYWRSRFGQRYAELNKSAAARNVKITRTYILRDSAQLIDKVAVMQAQTNFSNVRVLTLRDVPIEDNEIRDFFVIDQELAVEFYFHNYETITHIDVITNRHDVDELSQIMKTLVHKAMPLNEATSRFLEKPELRVVSPTGET